MPLIDTVIDVVVKKIQDKHLVIAERDGTEYRFDPGRNEFIENETLSVRVTGMDKNLELGRKDELLGVVLDCKLSLESIKPFPAEMIETGQWNPEWLYGPTAAKDFFPDHCHQSWRMLAPDFRETILKDDADNLDRAFQRVQEGHHVEGMEIISEYLGKTPWLLDLNHLMGTLSFSNNLPVKAEKYFALGVLLSESILPESDDYVLDYRDDRNHFYMSHLHSLGDILLKTGRNDKALAIFENIYRLMPQDPGGVRFLLQEMTKKQYPLTEDKFRDHSVSPYLKFEAYSDFPLRDVYDPDTKPDYSNWLLKDEVYRHILIFNAHKSFFATKQLSHKEMYAHTIMHDLVETTLAHNEPGDLRRQFARKMASGQTRHDIIHEFGQVLMQHYAELNKQQRDAQKKTGKPV